MIGPLPLKFTKYWRYFRGEETIAAEANAVRRRGGVTSDEYFNITQLIEETLPQYPVLRKKGELRLVPFEDGAGNPPAFVTFGPPTLHYHRPIWSEADQGEPWSRFVLGHEVGHLVLHDHFALAYSKEAAADIKGLDPGFNVEWQANTLAYHLFVPDEFAAAIGNARDIARRCGVERDIAQLRLASTTKVVKADLAGDFCPRCGGLTLFRGGTAACDCS